MEQIVIFVLFVVASIVSSIIQNKKKKAEEQQHRQQGSLPPRSEPTITQWPKSARDWQEQLKRMLEGQAAPPVIKPVTKPVLVSEPRRTPARSRIPAIPPPAMVRELSEGDLEFKSPLHQSAAAHERVSKLQSRVEERFRAVDRQTTAHRPSVARNRSRTPSDLVQRLRRNPAAAREAFVASLIFGPPKSLES